MSKGDLNIFLRMCSLVKGEVTKMGLIGWKDWYMVYCLPGWFQTTLYTWLLFPEWPKDQTQYFNIISWSGPRLKSQFRKG